jgi:hypothetical protein
MSFGDFARNYLNPIYLARRAGLLYGAIVLASDMPVIVKPIFGLLALWLAWTGIRPWGNGRGISANDL